MKTLFLYLLFMISIVYRSYSQNDLGTPLLILLNEDAEAYVAGNLAEGMPMSDLSWAWSSSNACFPETQVRKFTGLHQLFEFEIPARTEVQIILTPKDKKHDMSLYAYMIGVGTEAIVPKLSSCIRCEADHKWDRPKAGKTQDHRRIVGDILAIHNPYKVIIGVAGANGLAEGVFTLEIKRR